MPALTLGNRTVCVTTHSVPGQLRMLQSATASWNPTAAQQKRVANRLIGPPCLPPVFTPAAEHNWGRISFRTTPCAMPCGQDAAAGWVSSWAAGGCREISPADDVQRQKAHMLPERHKKLILQLLVVSWPRWKTAVSLYGEKVEGHCGKSLPLSVIHSHNVIHRI